MKRATKFGLVAALALLAGVQSASAGKKDDTFTWATDREAAVVDTYYNNTRELVLIGELVWDGLLSRDTTGKIIPGLATSWKWVDNKTIEADLKTGVKFHDGSDFDADDVVYTLQFRQRQGQRRAHLLQRQLDQDGRKARPEQDPHQSAEAIPAALDYLANACKIVPNGHFDKAPAKADGKKDFAAVKPIGTGAYKVADVKSGEYILMERNDSYFRASQGRQAIRFRTIKDKQTQIAELLTGGVDWIWDVPKDQAERLKGIPASHRGERQDVARLVHPVRCQRQVGQQDLHGQEGPSGRRARHQSRVHRQEPGRRRVRGRSTRRVIRTSSAAPTTS